VLRLGLEVVSGLVPSYYPVIVVTVISSGEQDWWIKCYQKKKVKSIYKSHTN